MWAIALLAALSIAAPALSWAQRDAAKLAVAAPTISVVRAHLFQNKMASWSDDILDPQYGDLWNSIAGSKAANATLIIIEVSGPPGGTYTGFFGPQSKYLVRLLAKESGSKPKKLLDQSQVIPVLNDQGKVYLSFLFHQNGCAPVYLTASIIGVHSSKPIEKSLNFACGE